MSQQVPQFYQGRPMTVPSVETSSSNLAPYNEWLQVCQRQDEFPFFIPAKTQAHWGTRPAVSEPRTQTYAADALPNLGPPKEFGTAEQESYRNASKWNLIDLSRTAVSSVNVDQGLQHVSSRDVSLLRRALSDMGPRRRFLPYTVPMRKRHQGSSRVESGQQNYTQIQSPDDLHSHAFRCKGERAVLQSQKSTSGQSVHMHQKANGHNIVINKLQDNLPDPTALQSYSYFPSSLTDAGNSVVYPSSPPCPKPSKSAHMQEPVPLPDTIADIAESVITKLCVVFNKVEHYRRLLSCGTSDAQKLLDAFQMLLDTKWFHNRTQLIAAMRRLSEQEKLYPTCFSLSGPSPSLEDGPVASGSFADIYKIRFQGEQTCYKVIRVYQKSQVEHLAKVYAREAILWGQLSHPNILPFYGLLRFGPRIAFVSRWATNGNLEEYLAHNPDVNRILLCLDTAAGVEYLHNNDIVHGDLKGLNVLIDGSGRACLGDFGVSSVSDPQILKWASQSTMASKGGTIRWQAPELLGPEDPLKKVHNSKASDVFAWANVCYEIFTGRLPFYEISNQATIMLSIMQGQTPSRPRDDDAAWLKHGLNEHLWSLLEDCWLFQSPQRPDMTDVISRLNIQSPIDSRPGVEWVENAAVRFRNANSARGNYLLESSGPFWEDLGSLVSRIVPEIGEMNINTH